MAEVQLVQEMRADAVKANDAVARGTLAKQGELGRARAEAEDLRSKLEAGVRDLGRRLGERRQKLEGEWGDAAVARRHAAAAQEAETMSETIHERFCNTEIEVSFPVPTY